MNDLEQRVHGALDNAKENGYTVFLAGTPQEIADDLIEYCQALEDVLSYFIIPHVIAWQQKQGETL